VTHVVVDPRVIRRVIKHQRGLTGFGLEVPHEHCCVVERASLLTVVTEAELGRPGAGLPSAVVLVARPEDADVRGLWRRAFHGSVHRHLEEKVAAGTLSHALIRERINRIGQTEFDEARAVLHGEELLFSGADDRETYIEFAAFYLELLQFEPDALHELFPSIRDAESVETALAHDVDVEAILDPCRPAGAADLDPFRKPPAVPSLPLPDSTARVSTSGTRASRTSSGAALRGSLVGAMIAPGSTTATGAIDELAERLEAALLAPGGPPEAVPSADEWRDVLRALAAAATRSDSTRAVEARILHDLQKACVDAERPRYAVDVITWLTSLSRRPVVRPLPVMSVVRVARHLAHAFEKSHRAGLAKTDRKLLVRVFRDALRCAKENARRAIKPALECVLDEVGLAPSSVPERVAREKLCEEVLDLVLARGSLGLSQLRDALSRSSLKLRNVRPGELLSGDAVLRADARLAERLDGVYRRGEIYLRSLQKVSSVAFGTRSGRLLTLHLVLPLILSFVLLEGVQHLAHPIARALGHRHVHLLTPPSFLVVAIFFYGVIHSAQLRRSALGVLRGIGGALHALFIGLPRYVLSSAPVRALLRGRTTSLVAKPLFVGVVVYVVARSLGLERGAALIGASGFVLGAAVFLGTAIGLRVDEIVSELVLGRVRALSRRVLPGLFALILEIFRVFVERVERGIYTVDEWLTFKQGQGSVARVAKGAAGAVWFFMTYLIRIYVNVLIEPQVNPIKHFPVVTVSHKIVLPLSPTILDAVRTPLAPLGAVASNTIAGSTVFLLPGAFGFLVWELKANWNLYDQNRSQTLEAVSVGHHGETMHALLVAGFHSGTLPKVHAKLRRAARRSEAKANACRATIHEVEHALEMFVERELVSLLRESERWVEQAAGELSVRRIEVGSNRIRVGIACPAVAPDVAWIHFEEQSGLLLASVRTPGFIRALAPKPRALLETALAGVYKKAGVDLVREQIAALLGEGVPYDVSPEGLVTWPGDGYESEVVYDLDAEGLLLGSVRGAALAKSPPTLAAEALIFRRQHIRWAAWVAAFSPSGGGARVISGPSLLTV